MVLLCHTDGAAAMTGWLSGLTARITEVAPECKSTHCVIHREMLATRAGYHQVPRDTILS